MSTYQINHTRRRKGGIVLCEVKKDEEIIATALTYFKAYAKVKSLICDGDFYEESDSGVVMSRNDYVSYTKNHQEVKEWYGRNSIIEKRDHRLRSCGNFYIFIELYRCGILLRRHYHSYKRYCRSLKRLRRKYKNEGLVVYGFPIEPS